MSDVLSRRAFVGKVAAGAAVAAVAGAGAKAVSAREQIAPAASTEPALYSAEAWAAPGVAESTPPWELLAPLTVGAAVGDGWRVAGLTGVSHGSCVLTLENERGRAHRVHLCGNGGQPQGLVHTERVDLLVMNGGQGDLPTDEGLAQAVAAVAHVIAANEGAAGAAVSALVPQAERLERLAAAAQLR